MANLLSKVLQVGFWFLVLKVLLPPEVIGHLATVAYNLLALVSQGLAQTVSQITK